MKKVFLTFALVSVLLSGCVNAYRSQLMLITYPSKDELKAIVREAMDECLKDEKCGYTEQDTEK